MRCIWDADSERDAKFAAFRMSQIGGTLNSLHLGCRKLAGLKIRCILDVSS